MGLRVRVADPHPDPLFPPFIGCVVFVNGDALDVLRPDGSIDCYPDEWCEEIPMDTPTKNRGGRPALSPDGRPRYRCTVSLPPELGDYIEARVAAGEKRSAVVARAVRLLVESGR